VIRRKVDGRHSLPEKLTTLAGRVRGDWGQRDEGVDV